MLYSGRELKPDSCMAHALHKYLLPLQTQFRSLANDAVAKGQSDYMLSKFAYYGIKKPVLNTITKKHFKDAGLPEHNELEAIVKNAWQQPQREWHYFAMALARKFTRNTEPNQLELYKWMITNNSWWDTVDEIAVHLVGSFFKKYPELTQLETEKMMASDNMWLQRTAILFQRTYKEETGKELLFDYCARLAHDDEFFIRKVIGWALREYSKYNPEAVKEFVNKTSLKPLSVKEALRLME